MRQLTERAVSLSVVSSVHGTPWTSIRLPYHPSISAVAASASVIQSTPCHGSRA